jgi:hypothetical protein
MDATALEVELRTDRPPVAEIRRGLRQLGLPQGERAGRETGAREESSPGELGHAREYAWRYLTLNAISVSVWFPLRSIAWTSSL